MIVIKSSDERELFSLLLEQIKKDLDEGENVVLVVPAQATFSVEKAVFDALDKPGFFKLRIVRGQKLHEEIMHECGYPGLTAINTIGRSMVLRRVSACCKDELKAFSGVYSDSGFIDMAGDFIVQLKQNNVTDNQLDELIESSPEGSIIKNKLLDMRLISKGYKEALYGKFTDSEDLLDFVTTRVKDSSLVKNSKIYYYGFYSFTKREYAYLSELERCSRGLSLALLSGNGPGFEITVKTERKLQEIMPETAIISGNSSGISFSKRCPSIHFVRCANPFSQAKTIASDIRRLVREKAYSYSDIAVFAPESDVVTGAIERVFSFFEIPLFKDEKRSILHTAAADAIAALLNISCGAYEASDILRLLKSGFVNVDEDDVLLLENYVKQYHIKGDKFLEPFKYGRDKFVGFEKTESVRSIVLPKLKTFTESMSNSLKVKDKILCLYEYLDKQLNLSEKLDDLSASRAEEGFADASEESARLWDGICSIFDQCSELMGDEILSNEEFSDILKTSFSDVKVGVLPQAEGRVQLGSINRSFVYGRKAVYIAGFNDGFIPSDRQSTGILSDEEINGVSEKGLVLAKTSDAYTDEELYMISKAMAAPQEYLWIGYCVSDSSGSDMKASPLLADIKKVYVDVQEENDISSDSCATAFLEGRDFAAAEMALHLREAMGGRSLNPLWKEVYNNIKDDADIVRQALEYTKQRTALSKDLAKKLFAKENEFSFSPSRMDGFASCPFKHFISYGLRPSVPEEFGIGGSEVGSIYHEVLMQLCQKVEDWKKIDDAGLEDMIDGILKEISEFKLDGVMLSGKAEIYTSKRIRQVCIRFAKHMIDQIKAGSIEKMYLETAFGRKGTFPPITLNTSSGKVYIEGRIDRVDICPDENGKYVRVIDYKSGNVKFNKDLVRRGLSLQLMVYLEGVMGEYKNAVKSGVYYFCIKDPKVAATVQDLPAEELSEEILAKINKEYKLDGMDVDEEFISQFTDTISGLCERLTSGDISVEPKQIINTYDSCAYCEFSGICFKDME